MNNEEIWKPVKNYEGIYEVSSLGRIKSLKRTVYRKDWNSYETDEKILTPYKNSIYDILKLSKNGKSRTEYVHQLVLKSFNYKESDNFEVCHNDGNSKNNNINNLRWGTRKENTLDKIKHGTTPKGKNIPKLTGSKNPAAKLKECEVSLIKKLLSNKISVTLLSKMFKVEKTAIKNIRSGKNWKYVI